MTALGIELHQVSLSALIVVLGLVVDDAFVFADYVALLDQGVPPEAAAWRSATELPVPVLTAMLTSPAPWHGGRRCARYRTCLARLEAERPSGLDSPVIARL
jgi:hypothetical protein